MCQMVFHDGKVDEVFFFWFVCFVFVVSAAVQIMIASSFDFEILVCDPTGIFNYST